MPFGGKNE
jgi:calcium-dependent protein kinase